VVGDVAAAKEAEMRRLLMGCLLAVLLLLFGGTMGIEGDGSEESRFGFVGIGQDWDDLTEMGFGWDRPHPGPANWNQIEPTPGQYDIQRIDQYVNTAQSYGVQTLFTIWPFADWDQETCHADLPVIEDDFPDLAQRRGLPCDVDAYQTFVRGLVERYDGDGHNDMPGLLYPVKHWEVANEPEMNEPPLVFFQGTAADYVELLDMTAEAIGEADLQAVVVQGGAAGMTASMESFWQEVFGSGGADYFDVANVHSINGPEDLWTNDWAALLAQYDVDKPFWVTEVQISTEPSSVKPALSEEEQAEWIVKGFVEAFGNGATRAFYTLYRANPSMSPQQAGAALIDVDGREKPALFAMQTLINKLRAFESVAKLNQTQYEFIVEGKTIHVLWGTGPLPEGISGQVVVTDIYGHETTMDAADLTLSDAPVFVESVYQVFLPIIVKDYAP
jgi:hypothetical protein